MSRVVRITILAVVALSTAVLTGCSSNPSGVHLQDPPPQATSTSSAAPAASAPPTPQPPPVLTSTGHSTPISPASSPGATSPAPSAIRGGATVSSSSTTAAASSNLTPVDPEAVDRMAIEAVWTKYWNATLTLGKLPAHDRQAAMETVAVPALATIVVTATAKDEASGKGDYGTVTHRPFWATSVGGKATAVMADCMNTSMSGTLNIKTGQKLTVGVPRDNFRIAFVRTAANKWVVSKVDYVTNVVC